MYIVVCNWHFLDYARMLSNVVNVVACNNIASLKETYSLRAATYSTFPVEYRPCDGHGQQNAA